MTDSGRDLELIDATLADIDPGQSEQYFGVRMMRQSLERRRDQILGEAHGWLDVALTRGERSGTGAELSLVAGVTDATRRRQSSLHFCSPVSDWRRAADPRTARERFHVDVDDGEAAARRRTAGRLETGQPRPPAWR